MYPGSLTHYILTTHPTLKNPQDNFEHHPIYSASFSKHLNLQATPTVLTPTMHLWDYLHFEGLGSAAILHGHPPIAKYKVSDGMLQILLKREEISQLSPNAYTQCWQLGCSRAPCSRAPMLLFIFSGMAHWAACQWCRGFKELSMAGGPFDQIYENQSTHVKSMEHSQRGKNLQVWQ